MKRSSVLPKPIRPCAATRLLRSVRRLRRSELGVTSSEYATLLAVVIITVVVSIMTVGGNLSTGYSATSSALALVGGETGGDGAFHDDGGKEGGPGSRRRNGPQTSGTALSAAKPPREEPFRRWFATEQVVLRGATP